MDRIPVEILHFIFIQLDLKDRLECMLVCRFWYDTLDRRSLCNTLNISHKQFDGFKAMVDRLSYRCTQVEELTIQFKSTFDKRRLCNMFPNLRQLKLRQGRMELNPGLNYMQYDFHFTHPKPKLETVGDFGNCELAHQLAISNLCGHPKTLYLKFWDEDLTRRAFVFPQLINMPVLENLRLSETNFTLMDLELIHSNLGSIKKFQVIRPVVLSGEVPQNITPASLITKLCIEVAGAEDLQTHVQLYQYMSKKYPSVNQPVVSDETLEHEADDDYAVEVYKDGVLPYYQAIGSQLESFSFNNYLNGLDAFKKFDESGCELKNLKIKSMADENVFLEELTHSNQAKYIQYLELEEILPLPLTKLKQMEVLQSLKIHCYGSTIYANYERKVIDFSQLIEACPATLSTLITEYVDLAFGELPSNTTCITYLQLSRIALTQDLAKIIETSFPELSTLILDGTLTTNLTISLPNHNLEEAKISTKYTEGKQNIFLVKIANNDKVQDDAQRQTQNHGMNRVTPVPKKCDVPLVLTFICASVNDVYFTTDEIKDSKSFVYEV